MYYLLIFKAQIDWTQWSVIVPTIIVVLGYLGFLWRIVNKKADKDELTKLKYDMEAKVDRVEKRTIREHDLIRKETIQILQPMRDQINTIFNWLKPDGE